jgi:hypothetical protein
VELTQGGARRTRTEVIDLGAMARAALIAALLAATPAARAAAQGSHVGIVALTTSNDIVGGTDDFYTAALELTASVDGHPLRFGERMFTDRFAGARHDETFAEADLGRRAALWRGLTAWVGVLRVGRGLFGQSFQNRFHALIGSDELALAYPGRTAWYPTARATLVWPLSTTASDVVFGRSEFFTAPGFRTWVRATAGVEHAFGVSLSVRATAGAMANVVRPDLIARVTRPLLPVWSLAMAWGRVVVTWAGDTLGVSQRYLTLSVRVGRGRRPRPPAWR